jgi:hypothetical protein
MEVGAIVKLKRECLGNPAGTIGVVFYNYGDGFQAIFENGNYDGFSLVSRMPVGGKEEQPTEANYFLEEVGLAPFLDNYQFKNVIQVESDFRQGIFKFDRLIPHFK